MLSVHIIKQRRQLTIDVHLALARGDSLGLFGSSGAGKSTVLACIAGLEEPDAGHVRFGDEQFFPASVPLHKRGIGLLTQDPGLFPHLLVRENVVFGLTKSSLQDAETAAWISSLQQRLKLESIWNAPATSISGGQARRVSLARTLARRPRLILLDEPFTGLDRELVRELIASLLVWSRTLHFSMIAVDHQAEILERLCPQQVAAIEAGRIIQQGSWKDLRQQPATPLLHSLLAPL